MSAAHQRAPRHLSHPSARPSALLLRLLAHVDGWLRTWWRRRVEAFAAWRRRSREALREARSTLGFEALEPRVLLSADLNPGVQTVAPASTIQLFTASDVPTLNLTPLVDADGTQVTLAITGPGSAQLIADGSGYALQLNDTDTTTRITLDASGGDGRVELTGISAAGDVGSLALASADLLGNASFGGKLDSLALGDISNARIEVAGSGDVTLQAGKITDSQLHAPQARLALFATQWLGTTPGASALEVASLRNLNVTGDFGANLEASGLGISGYTLGSVQVGGAISGGSWSIHGRGSSLQAGSTSAAWQANLSNTLVQFITRGDASGSLAATALQLLQVGGTARNLTLMIGADLGDDAALGGTGSNADAFRTGTLAKVRISGGLVDSQLLVSLDPVDGVFGDGNDRQLGSAPQRLQEFIVGGQVTGSIVVAPAFPSTVRIGGATLAPGSLPEIFGSTAPDTLAPVLSAQLQNDTGASANDGMTNTPAVLVRIVEAGTIAAIEARLADTDAFQAVAALLQSDGSYLIDALALAGLRGNPLSDGAYALQLRARDGAGNVASPITLGFTLDTAAPALSQLGIDPADDTGVAGDLVTTAATVVLTGQTEPGAIVHLAQGDHTTTADGSGAFRFTDIALALGSNAFSFTATDAAGNSRNGALSIRRDPGSTIDNEPPTLSVALIDDSGPSSTDGITSDPRLAGQARDNVGTVQLLAVLDPPGSNPTFTDLSRLLAVDGRFTIDRATLDALAGGTLADGHHTLRLLARDAAGNSSTLVEHVFTLDSVAPVLGGFGLSAADASNAALDETSSATVQLKGDAEAGATIRLAAQNLTVVAGAGGSFVLPGVALLEGANLLTLTATDAAGNTSSFTRSITRTTLAQSDAVLTWNNIALRAVQLDVTDPPVATRTLALVSLAQYDALAAIEGTPAFLVQRSVSGPVSAQAAAAVAAYRVLAQTYPAQKAAFDAALTASLAAIPDGAAKDAGIALGISVADGALAVRANDGSENFGSYEGSTAIGQWRPTGPTFDVADEPFWKNVQPFALTSPSEFRPGPPPALDTATYATDVEEIKRLGSATSVERTAAQTQMALFWADGKGSYTPPGHWNAIAEDVAQAQGNSLSANARLFAQLNVALADAAIACWDAKYTYGLWRPETAIQNADLDNNAATTADPNWRPLLLTPPHPEYVSGHSTFSAAAAGVLAAAFGDDTAFSTTSPTLPGVTRSFSSFSQAAEEAGRSRVYGGIHYEFTNQAGQALGRQVAAAVLAKFALTEDTQAPNVVLDNIPAATHTNLTLGGQVLDNLSGVAAAQFRIDNGPLQALSLDAEGGFTITTAFPTDGSADGVHTITVLARDAAGNISAGVARSFTLDTAAPTLSLSSLADGDALTNASRLTGTAAVAGGTPLTSLSYRLDGGTVHSLIFDAATGAFDNQLNFGQLDVGEHTLILSARDAAGNTATLNRSVKVEMLAPFTITSLNPSDGSDDIGVTQRPQVNFSRAVNAATLTAESFYATGPDGSKLAATIVPAGDGSFAWLFFNDPMPGGSLITVHLEGSKIRSAADGGFLDADGDGSAGGTRTASFTTVSTTMVSGTTLRGKVVDPGPDLEPMTFDDIRRGPDGIIHTPDDVFLNPIVHAKVFILGQEDKFVFTDANGNFELTDVPAGEVKVAIDGRTATNAPTGVFWPEMVMATQLQPGIVNTVMGSMGSTAERLANADRQEVYLPRVATSILQTVSDSVPTVITVDDPAAAPALSEAQRQALTLTVNPGSAVGENGQVLDNVQIGISTVPPELVRDMLPPGVLQHTFDITIQAPGVATFTEPVQITFPNVFNAAPGEKLAILSFDHTTGMLVINGTGTVSADGLSVVSDPDSGIRAPGWHGVAPPGGCGGSGGPPPAPIPPAPTETVVTNPAQALAFITGNASGTIFNKTWTAPPPLPGTPVPPPIPGCEVPPHVPGNNQQPFINVTIEIDGPLADFAKQTGDLGLTGQAFTLSPGGGSKTLSCDAKTYVEMFGANGIAGLNRDQLYGSKIKITVIEQKTNGDRVRTIDTYYVDRWVDVVDAPQANTLSGNTAAFMRTNTDGVVREKNVDMHLGTDATTFDGPFLGSPFDLGGSVSGVTTAVWKFDPFLSGARSDNFDILVADPVSGNIKVGTIEAKGTATNATEVSINESGYEAELKRVLQALVNTTSTGADGQPGAAGVDDNGVNGVDDQSELGYAGSDDALVMVYDFGGGVSNQATVGAGGAAGSVKTITNAANVAVVSASFKTHFAGFLPGDIFTAAQLDTKVDAEGDALLAAVKTDYSGVSGITVQSGDFGADVTMAWHDVPFTFPGGAVAQVLGSADFDPFGNAAAKTALQPLIASTNTTIGQAAKQYALAEALNQSVSNSGQFGVGINVAWGGVAGFAEYVADTVSHEIGHTFGLNDAYLFSGTAGIDQPPNDLMVTKGPTAPDRGFAASNVELLQASVGSQANGDTPINAGLTLTTTNFNLPNSTAGIQDPPLAPSAAISVRLDTRDLLNHEQAMAGEVAADGPGQLQSMLEFTLSNPGDLPLHLGSIALANGNAGFRIIDTGVAGSTLNANATTTLRIAFDPQAVGTATDELRIASDSPTLPVYSIPLEGRGISVAPLARVVLGNNNLGGQTLGAASLQRPNIYSISNDGSEPLVISGISLSEGAGSFQLLGLPPDLATHPIVLSTGQSMSFGASFTPDRLGLQRGLINVTSNDPSQPNLRLSLIGTGVAAIPTAHWGKDYFAIENPDLPDVKPLRTISDDAGNFSFFLPSNAHYHLVGFDPETGLITHGYGNTAPSGQGTDLTATLVFGASTAKDSDFDGLPDDIEFAIGSSAIGRDTDKDSLDDFTEIQQGLDPLGGLGIPVGVVSAASLLGSAEAVVVVGATDGSSALTALIATGTQGLATVDASRFTQPQVLAQLDLPGTSVDVAADPVRSLAVVAAQDAGLHIVDIRDPAAPVLRQTIAFDGAANAVVVRDGIAYVATGTDLAAIDLNTGELRSTLDLGAVGGGVLTDIAIDGSTLFTMDNSGLLRAIAISGDLLTPRDAIAVAGSGGSLFIGDGVAYLGTTTDFAQGYQTVDVSDPADLQLLSGVDATNVAGQSLAANGSGLLVTVGNLRGPVGQQIYALDLSSTGDPTDTGAFVSRINLPSAPKDVTLANGLAFVANGSSGLQIVNYIGFDTQGVAPSVSIAVDAIDADPATPGTQVLEGRTLRVRPTLTDDVQVRNVELLVNGQVVSNDVSFPFELFAQAPALASGGTTVSLQVRATDTGGNVALSNMVTLKVVPDTFAPQINAISLADGDRRFFVRSVDLVFDEPLDVARLSASGVSLVRAGNDGVFDTADDVSIAVRLDTRSFGQALSIVIDSILPAGDYRLRIDPAIIADRAGNTLSTPVQRLFSIRPASDVHATSGVPDIPTAPSANPGQQIGIAVPFDPSTARAEFKVSDAAGNVTTRTVSVLRTDAAQGLAFFTVPLDAVTGDAVVFSQVGGVRTDFPDGSFPLQILPLIADVQVESVAADGSSAQLLISGFGFAEGSNSEYRFGTDTVLDAGTTTGPDVFGRFDPELGFIENGFVRITVPLSDGVFGAIGIKTAGGVSAAYTTSLSSITATALSGTPAEASEASANAGQAITLHGSGLTTASDVLLRYTDVNGTPQMVRLSPSAASADGSSATLIVPAYANGAFTLQRFGSASQPLLQIVPTLGSIDIQDRTVLFGSGFVEGATRYRFAGSDLTDTPADPNNIDVYYDDVDQNRSAYLDRTALPRHGLGAVTVSTAGGSSAPLLLDTVRTDVPGTALSDLAVDAAGKLWVGAYNTNPGLLQQIDPATGAVLQTITMTDAFGTPYAFNTLGLQVLAAPMTLGGSAVPAGSLLVFNGSPGPDLVLAVDPASGAVLASLALDGNYDLTAGTFDAASGRLFITEQNGPGNRLIVLDAATGAQTGTVTAPFNVQSWSGLAVDPASGHLWLGAINGGPQLVEYQIGADGSLTELGRLDTRPQGLDQNEISGLSFGPDGKLYVSSTQGEIYRLNAS